MKDLLAQYVDDYNKGIIDATDLARRLSFLQWKEEKSVKTLPVDYMKIPLEPSELMTERERFNALTEVIVRIKNSVPSDDWRMFVMTAKGETQTDIADALDVSRATVVRHLERIGELFPDLQELLHKPSPIFYADTPSDKLKYPMDTARHFTDDDGKVRCHVPVYLREQGCESLCTYCEHCTSKDQKHPKI